MVVITVPYHPRDYQNELYEALKKYKRAFVLWHRRAGKDIGLWNFTIKRATQIRGIHYYLLPTYAQAKKIIWDGKTNDGRPFLDFIPHQIVRNKNSTELKIELINGSIIQLIGTDNYDSIRGTNPITCVFSEYAYQNPEVWEVVRPILSLNGGIAVFNTTPNGANHAKDLWEMAKKSDDWFTQMLTVNDTRLLSEEDIQRERDEGMSEEMIQQEYFCSFTAGIIGNYYAKEVQRVRDEQRICVLPVEKLLPVHVIMDLGRNDENVMAFVQFYGNEIRVIDYYAHNGEAVSHYVEELNLRGYRYGFLCIPHDGFAKRLEAKRSVAEQYETAGFKVLKIPEISINNGINLVRKYFSRLRFHQNACEPFLTALENYRREYDVIRKTHRDIPLHDWASHPADCMRYIAVCADTIPQILGIKDYKIAHDKYISSIIEEQEKPFQLNSLDQGMDKLRRSHETYLRSIYE